MRHRYRSRQTFLLRLSLWLLCAVLGLLSIRDYVYWRQNRDALLDELAAAGTLHLPQVATRVGRERTPHHAKLAVARSIIHGVLTAEPIESLDESERAPQVAARVGQLERADQLLEEVLKQQPDNWQASMLRGASIYLDRSLRRDPLLITSAADWETPLRQALETTRGKDEPRRFLTMAYLELWNILSPDKQVFARQLLQEAFAEDPDAFPRGITAWLDVAPSTEAAFELIPDRPEAWETLESLFEESRRWHLFIRARNQRLASQERFLQGLLTNARQRLRLGDLEGGRTLLADLLQLAPVDGRFQPIVQGALEIFPPGLSAGRVRRPLRSWLIWHLSLEGTPAELFSPLLLRRILAVLEDLSPKEAAIGSLLAEEFFQAERVEQLIGFRVVSQAADWADYRWAKAQWLIDHGRAAEAAAYLDSLGTEDRSRPFYWNVRLAAANQLADTVTAERARKQLAALLQQGARQPWQPTSRGASQRILVPKPAKAITLEVRNKPDQGAVIEIILDGKPLGMHTVRRKTRIVQPVQVAPGIHYLVVKTVAGEQVAPKTWDLLPADDV